MRSAAEQENASSDEVAAEGTMQTVVQDTYGSAEVLRPAQSPHT